MSAARQDFSSLFRCPACLGDLTRTPSQMACQACGAKYPVTDGTPVLLRRDVSVFDPDQAAIPPKHTPTERRGAKRLLPSITTNLASTRNYARLRALLSDSVEPLILSVGGGEGGKGQEELAGLSILTTDVVLGPKTDAVADGHDLPFANSAFDAVIVQAVLEHVLDPTKCVAEIHRVLKPGGFVYAETPFMQPVHMGRYDFTRYTALGHRRLFRMFDAVDTGITGGPGSALAWASTYFVASLGRSQKQRRVLQAIGRLAFFWLRFFDYVLSRNDAAFDAASGFYLLGRRAEHPLPDDELVAQYRGGMRL